MKAYIAQNYTKSVGQYNFLEEKLKLLTRIWYEPLALVKYLTHFTL